MLEVRNNCTRTFSQCNKALKLAAEEIGFCARDSDDQKEAPWTKNHDDLNDVVEAGDAVDVVDAFGFGFGNALGLGLGLGGQGLGLFPV